MTCEVAVMNKSAVALAADSAATLSIQPVHKIYIVNKLFALSEKHPVGIMIYGKPDLLGVPWETIIEMYRRLIPTNDYFATLTEYSQDLIGFIESSNSLFPEGLQKDFFRTSLQGYYTIIKKEIDDEVKHCTQKKKITKSEIEEIVNSVIHVRFQHLKKLDLLLNFSLQDAKNLITKYSSLIRKVQNDVFVNLPIRATASRNLKNIARYLFSRNIFQKNLSGVVIAGFGNDEIFPHVESFEIEGLVNGKAKYRAGKKSEISQANDSSIIPFAQEDMVRAFMEGIHPKYYSILLKGPEDLLKGLGKILPEIDEMKSVSKAKLKSIVSKLEEINKGILKVYQEALREYRKKEHIGPIMNAVSYLPKQELAEMAESLVRLVALKRRMSVREVETVGGPIDVAVVSKADGFVWIKRKSYFEQELNPNLSGS